MSLEVFPLLNYLLRNSIQYQASQAGIEWFAPLIFHLIHRNLANAPSAVSRDLA